MHGRAALLDVGGSEQAGFRQTLLEIYVPRYGAGWESFLDSGVVYARIDAERMFTFHMDEQTQSTAAEHSALRYTDQDRVS